MKILAEIADGFNYKGNYMEIFKNPTDKEIEIVKKESKYNSIRGVIYDDGTSYIWPGDILHDEINSFIRGFKIDINGFRFACEELRWVIDLHDKYSFEQGKELIDKHKNFLQRIGLIYGPSIQFFYGTNKEDYHDYCVLYSDVKTAKIHRLRKVAEIYTGFTDNQTLNYMEIFKNPTDKEIEIVKDESKYGAIRGIIENNGNIYIWPGDILHENINSQRNSNFKLNIDDFRFAYERNEWIIDLHYKYTFEEGKKLINKYKNELLRIAPIYESDTYIFNGSNYQDYQIDCLSYNEILNSN